MQQRTVTCYGQSNSIPAGKKKLYTTYIREATLPHTGLRWRTLTDGSLWNEPGRYTVTDYNIREENENCYSFTLSQITRLRVHVHAFYFADKQKTNLVKTYGEKHYFQMT